MRSHNICHESGRHVCQVYSGHPCIETGCMEDAGTWWGPLWCPEHDQERLDRIGQQAEQLLAAVPTVVVCAMCKRPIDRTSAFHTCEPS